MLRLGLVRLVILTSKVSLSSPFLDCLCVRHRSLLTPSESILSYFLISVNTSGDQKLRLFPASEISSLFLFRNKASSLPSCSAVVAIPKIISLRDLFSSEIELGLETRPDIEKKIGPQIREKKLRLEAPRLNPK